MITTEYKISYSDDNHKCHAITIAVVADLYEFNSILPSKWKKISFKFMFKGELYSIKHYEQKCRNKKDLINGRCDVHISGFVIGIDFKKLHFWADKSVYKRVFSF